MKAITFAILFISSISLISQPIIGPDAIVTIGENEPTTFLTIDGQDWGSGNIGQNQQWDFSTLPSGDQCDYIALDPSESPYYDSFPNSDIYFVCTSSDSQGFTAKQHTFYHVQGDILQLAGNVSVSISNPSFDSIFIVYTDPLDWATFPYSYESTSEDSFEARITSYSGGQVIVAIQSGTSVHEVDSYGTLTTPSGTFENTIRVKRIELALNSVPGVPFNSPIESYRYTWYSENENGVILNLDSIVIKDFNNNVLNTNYAGSYRLAGPTSTSTVTKLEQNITIYPNPTAEEINIELTNIADYEIYIYNNIGEKMSYSVMESTNNSRRIKMAQSAAGAKNCFITLLNRKSGIKISKALVLEY